jgi:hypothetical protein
VHQKHSHLTTRLLFLVIVCGGTSGIADETDFKGTVKPQLQVSPAAGQVAVDGVIGGPEHGIEPVGRHTPCGTPRVLCASALVVPALVTVPLPLFKNRRP